MSQGSGAQGAHTIDAGAEELRIDAIDVAAAREALAGIGVEGAGAIDRLSARETIDLLTHLRRLSGAVAAVQARALVHLEAAVTEDCRERGETPKQALKIARAETSHALKHSASCAGQTMSSSRRLVRSMPGMLTGLAHGRLIPASVHGVGRTMAPASPAQRAQVDEILTAHLPYLEDCGPQELAGEAEKVLHGLDPQGAARRHHMAKKDRHVTVRRGEHGMCTLTASLPGLDGARIRKGLSVAAERARAQGDRRGHQQIMADLFVDALIGRGEGIDPSTLDVGVIISDRSLLAPDHADPAVIEGYGPVPYEHVREEMLAAMAPAEEDPELAMTLRRLYTDPEDGQLVGVESRARSFPRALARFLRMAHQTCRAPHCDAPIRQLDHIVPWAQGGTTTLDNGNGTCAGHNQKEEAGVSARVVRDEVGTRRTVEWTTRYGQKARRRGINVDPLGTGWRLLGRAAAENTRPETETGRPEAETARPVPGLPETDRPETETPRPVPTSGVPPAPDPTSPAGSAMIPDDAPHASFRRAIAHLTPRPPVRHSYAERRRLVERRKDFVFHPRLTVISDVPWRGPEPEPRTG